MSTGRGDFPIKSVWVGIRWNRLFTSALRREIYYADNDQSLRTVMEDWFFGAAIFPIQYPGLRVQTATGMQELCLVDVGNGATGMGGIPKIRKAGITYDIFLVEIADANASPVRIRTSTGIRAIRRRT